MAYDINLQRAAKAARLAAGQPKYEDLCPTGPTPEDDERVAAECRSAFIDPPVLAVEPVVEPVVESVVESVVEAAPEFVDTVPAES